jgi:hypothetical protein
MSSGEVDVLSAARRDVLKQDGISQPRFCRQLGGPVEIDGTSERDCSDNEVRSGGPVVLVFERVVEDFPEPIGEYGVR